MAGSSDNDMIENFNLEKLAGTYQIARHFYVSFGWRCLPAWVIVHHHDCSRRGHNSYSKDFAGMDKKRIHRPDADKIMAFDLSAGVQNQHNQTFAFRVEIRMSGNVPLPVLESFFRRIAQLQTFRRRTLSQRRDLVFKRLRFEGEGLHQLQPRK